MNVLRYQTKEEETERISTNRLNRDFLSSSFVVFRGQANGWTIRESGTISHGSPKQGAGFPRVCSYSENRNVATNRKGEM